MLEQYERKRNFKKTPEPEGNAGRKRISKLPEFVVQKHDASRLHYDFRLEADGVLKSWAVPKGPSTDPHERRLAIQVEDHPIEYGSFEGTIPEAEYGGGDVIVWDKGSFEPLVHDTPVPSRSISPAVREGLAAGKLIFVLHGKKLHGRWALVRISGSENQWLLIKKADEAADATHDILEKDESVLTGKTIGKQHTERRKPDQARIAQNNEPNPEPPTHDIAHIAGVHKRKVTHADLGPMLATLTSGPFDNDDWAFEPKLDGIRVIAIVKPAAGEVLLISRRGLDVTHAYPNLCQSLVAVQKRPVILDGEIVATDSSGHPSFQALQPRINLTRKSDIEQAEREIPVTYYVFDILHIVDYDLRTAPYDQRRSILENEVVDTRFTHAIASTIGTGNAAFEAAVRNGFEGIVCKRRDSRYQSGRRSRSWLKVKTTLSDEFVVGGFTSGEGSRADTFGSLLLGQYDNDKRLQFCGHVGTGFNQADLNLILKQLRPLETNKSPFAVKPIVNAEAHWTKPTLTVEVKFAERTTDRQLRAPVFMRTREDKPAVEATSQQTFIAPKSKRHPTEHLSIEAQHALDSLSSHEDEAFLVLSEGELRLTSLNKILWPQSDHIPAITKRDLAVYLLTVSKQLLPHLHDRPITLSRYPNGIAEKHFFQRHWPHDLPDFVETVEAFSEDNSADVRFILCNNLASLMWLAQLANVETHAWLSSTSTGGNGKMLPATFTGSAMNVQSSALNYPDCIAFDLDPYIYSGKEVGGQEPEFNPPAFEKTCEIAILLRTHLVELGLTPFVKTSGKTGLHIFVPIKRRYPFDTTRAACEAICRYVMSERPNDVTLEWSTAKRRGKVFLDYNMNARSKTIASIYSPRATACAGVSMPVSWAELASVKPLEFNVLSAPGRMAEAGDLWADMDKFAKVLPEQE